MSIKLTDLLNEIRAKVSSKMGIKEEETLGGSSEETPTQPTKRGRGRPSRAELLARRNAELAAQQAKATKGMSADIVASIQAARKRRAQRDAELLATAKAEFDAAMQNKERNLGSLEREPLDLAVPPEEIPTPSFRGSRRAPNDDDAYSGEEPLDLDRAKRTGLGGAYNPNLDESDDESDREAANKISQDLEDYAAGNTRAHRKALENARKLEGKNKKKGAK